MMTGVEGSLCQPGKVVPIIGVFECIVKDQINMDMLPVQQYQQLLQNFDSHVQVNGLGEIEDSTSERTTQ